MADPLAESEELCRKSLESLEISRSSSSRDILTIETRLKDLLGRIAESKKKIMVRSPEGKKLADEVLSNAVKVHVATSALSSNEASENNLGEVSDCIKLLENSVENIEIYWKSFEYVTT